jgi:hypothetical protein
MMNWSDITRHFFFKVFPLVFCGLSVLFGVWKYVEPSKSVAITHQENAGENYLLAKNVTKLLREYPDSIPLHVAYYAAIQGMSKQDIMVFRQWEFDTYGNVDLWLKALQEHPKTAYKKAGYFNELVQTYFSGELNNFPMELFKGNDRHDAIARATFRHLQRQRNLANINLETEKRLYPNNSLAKSFPFFTPQRKITAILGMPTLINIVGFWLAIASLFLMGGSVIRFVFALDVFQILDRKKAYAKIFSAVVLFGLLGILVHSLNSTFEIHWFWILFVFQSVELLFRFIWKRRLPKSKSIWNEECISSILTVISGSIFLSTAVDLTSIQVPIQLLGFILFKLMLSIFPIYWNNYELKYRVPKYLLQIASFFLPVFYFFIWMRIDQVIPSVFMLFVGLLFISAWVIMMNNVLNRHPKFRVNYDAPTNYYKRIWLSMIGIWVLSQGALISIQVGPYLDVNQFLAGMGYSIPFYFLMMKVFTRWELNKNRKIPFQLLRLDYHYDFREMKDKRLIVVPTQKGTSISEPPVVGKIVSRILIGKNTEWLHVELFWPLSFEKKFYNHIAVKLAHPGHTYRRKNAVLAIRLLSYQPNKHKNAIPIEKTKSFGSGLLKALK